jgi:hypothetical protein
MFFIIQESGLPYIFLAFNITFLHDFHEILIKHCILFSDKNMLSKHLINLHFVSQLKQVKISLPNLTFRET